MNVLEPKAVIQSFERALDGALLNSHIYEREVGLNKHVYTSLWLDIERDGFRPAIYHTCQLQDRPHFSVISEVDLDDTVDLLYHFSLYTGELRKAIALVLRITLPKTDLSIPTITDIIPGAIFAEREAQEMMGVKVVGIPDDRRLFIPEDFPEGIYPWRRDETGPDKMLKVMPGKQGIQYE